MTTATHGGAAPRPATTDHGQKAVLSCRLCGSSRMSTFIDLGATPPCERFLAAHELDAPEPNYPLHVRICEECLLAQLPALITPEDTFTEYEGFEQIIRRGAYWSGLDLTQESVNRVSARLAIRELPHDDLQQGNALAIPWRDDTFDLVFSHGVLRHIPGIRTAQNETHHVLKPGDTLIAMLYSRISMNYQFSIKVVGRAALAVAYPPRRSKLLRTLPMLRQHLDNAELEGLRRYLTIDSFTHRNTDAPELRRAAEPLHARLLPPRGDPGVPELRTGPLLPALPARAANTGPPPAGGALARDGIFRVHLPGAAGTGRGDASVRGWKGGPEMSGSSRAEAA